MGRVRFLRPGGDTEGEEGGLAARAGISQPIAPGSGG